jgi:hypothetical protein
MSYATAKACFLENKQSVNAKSEPQLFNLYNGLLNLTVQLETDIAEMKRKLKQIKPA